MTAILEYFERRRDEFRRYSSGALTDAEIDSMFSVAADGLAGFIDGAIPLDDDAIVAINELVRIGSDGRAERHRYSYYLIDDRTEVRGYDLDPSHDPPSHRHLGPHSNVEDCDEVSLREACEEFWDVLADRRSQSRSPG